jgi:hypothetical protein
VNHSVTILFFSLTVRIAVSIIVALMAGAIACFVYKLGVFCLGSCLGLVSKMPVFTLTDVLYDLFGVSIVPREV